MSPDRRTALIWAVMSPDEREADIILTTSTEFIARYWMGKWWGVHGGTDWIDGRVQALTLDADHIGRVLVAGPTSYTLPPVPAGASEWMRKYLAAVVGRGISELWFCVNNQSDLEAAALVRIRVALRRAGQAIESEGIGKYTTRPPDDSYRQSPWYPAA